MYENKIKKFRKNKNLTLKQLSELTGISVGYLCHLEKGTRDNPSHHFMELIATALDKTIVEVFFEK